MQITESCSNTFFQLETGVWLTDDLFIANITLICEQKPINLFGAGKRRMASICFETVHILHSQKLHLPVVIALLFPFQINVNANLKMKNDHKFEADLC